jgi:hypothetical protein
MAVRILRCAIEQIEDWHPRLFVEPHVVAFVAVAAKFSHSPARLEVECDGVTSRWLGSATKCALEVFWHRDTTEKAERMRATTQSGPLVELASIALALILVKRVFPLGRLDVTAYGARADYRARKKKMVLEVSGTEIRSEFARRHRQKVVQALNNPFGWDACIVVCAFSSGKHLVRLSKHLGRS